jgi:hypothetical protein
LKAQTITFAPPTTVYVGQEIMLSATGGGSGNPVTFTIDAASTCATCASISGNLLTVNAAGSFLVDANQAGNTNYAPAIQVQAALTASALIAPGGAGSGIVTSQLTWLGAYPTGGDENQGTAAGDSFAINSQGYILISTTYGGTVIEVNGQTGAVTTLGSYGEYNNTGGVAVDNQDNLYVGGLYGAGSNLIAKVPYKGNGVYATLTDATSGNPPANCTGNDTTECVLAPLAAIPGGFGVASMKFDASGVHGGLPCRRHRSSEAGDALPGADKCIALHHRAALHRRHRDRFVGESVLHRFQRDQSFRQWRSKLVLGPLRTVAQQRRGLRRGYDRLCRDANAAADLHQCIPWQLRRRIGRCGR